MLQSRPEASSLGLRRVARRGLASRSSLRGTLLVRAVAAQPKATIYPEPDKRVDWDNLSFGLQHVAPKMFVAHWTPEKKAWQPHSQDGAIGLLDYQPIPMYPSAQVLNYGQSIFEGMKAQRSAKDRIVLFRPEENAKRFAEGAKRMSMPPLSQDEFVPWVQSVVNANASYVPPKGKGSLYIRPLMLGSGPILGLGPAPSYMFLVYAAAVGSYFKTGQLYPINLIVEEHFHRAAPGGMGGTKAAGNYSPVLNVQMDAKNKGFHDVVYLDAKSDTYLEEVSSCNIFVVKGKSIKTPPLSGTILPGVTRKSIIDLARMRGYTVSEEPVSVTEALAADEVFTTGTAVVLAPVGSITYKGNKRQYGKEGEVGSTAMEMYNALTRLQAEEEPDPFSPPWVVPAFK